MTRLASRWAARWLALILGCAAAWPISAPGWAQTPATDTPQTPPADSRTSALSAEQKQLIYQSVSAMHKNSAAPAGFRVAVGSDVPSAIELQPMPAAVITVIPQVKDTNVAMIEKQVVVVDPKSRKVLAVLTERTP
jgi:shikimate kinase